MSREAGERYVRKEIDRQINEIKKEARKEGRRGEGGKGRRGEEEEMSR